VIFVTGVGDHFVYNKTLGQLTALQCVEDGLLTLDCDPSAVAPELATKEVMTGFPEDGETPILEPALRPSMLEMLLIYSSGLIYHFMNTHIAE
jgi:hypothetical protein